MIPGHYSKAGRTSHTPIDLTRVVNIDKPSTRIYYDLQEIGYPDLGVVLDEFLKENS